MRHVWVKKPWNKRLVEMIQVRQQKIHGCRRRRLGIWTIGSPSVGEAEPRPDEDIETRGSNSHSPGNGSSGRTSLGVIIASDVADALRIEDFPGVNVPYYDANSASVDDFILAVEVVGETQ